MFCPSPPNTRQSRSEGNRSPERRDLRNGAASARGGSTKPIPQDEEGGGDAGAGGSPGPSRSQSERVQTAAERTGSQQGGGGGIHWDQVQNY